MLHAFLLSFGVIFVAELGDKSQLMALAFATRYKTVPVLIAITLATGIVHLFSVALGGVIGVLGTTLLSLGSIISAATLPALAVLGQSLTAVAQAAITLKLAFSGVGKAIVLGTKAKKAGVKESKALEKAGVTIFNSGIGWHEARIPTIASMVPRGAFSEITSKFKKELNTPFIATNRINTPEIAEGILERGEAG